MTNHTNHTATASKLTADERENLQQTLTETLEDTASMIKDIASGNFSGSLALLDLLTDLSNCSAVRGLLEAQLKANVSLAGTKLTPVSCMPCDTKEEEGLVQG